MPAPVECLEVEGWQALDDAALSSDQLERWECHLEACPVCQKRISQAEDSGDELRRLGRKLGDPTEVPADPTLVQVLERLHEVKIPDHLASMAPADLFFLQPAERPNVLGNLGHFEVEEVIGQGGMGVVLKAYEPALHRHVAIKVLAAAVAGSATARRRFTREAKAAAAVCHENIVPVYGVDEVGSLPYLVMQFVVGESLQDRLDRTGPLELIEVVRIGQQTAAGLAAAHVHGLIHRDIKPANLLLENDAERVKITDFGLARMIDDVQLTQDGVVAGTPEYMAPEQARGEQVDHLADLFSLGSVMYAMATGGPPFQASSAVAVLRQVSDDTQPPIHALNPDMPAWLDAIVARLMAKDPAQRFQSAAEVAELLTRYLSHLERRETVAIPELAVVAKKTERNLIGRFISLTPSLLVLIALGFGAGAWLAGCGGSDSRLSKEVPEFHHDFRGHPLPAELALFNQQEDRFLLAEEAEGFRIKVPRPWIPHPAGVGVKTKFGLKGDFEAIATVEIIDVDIPPIGLSRGIALFLDPVNGQPGEATAIDLFVEAASQGVRWWATDRTRKGMVPSDVKVARLGLRRTGTTLHYLWAPGTQGDEFHEIGQAEWPTDIGEFRIVAFLNKRPGNLDLRLLDLRIRGNWTNTPILNMAKGGLAGALLIGMVITLSSAVGLWLFIRRRRHREVSFPTNIKQVSDSSPK